jgi:dTMP kinase
MVLGAEPLRRTRGLLIAIEGIDQSGKRTQSNLLAREFSTRGYRTSVWDFPDYTTPIGRQLRAYLAGKNQLDYHAVHLLYAANKWERSLELNHEIANGRYLIVNRYSPSNLAYGLAHSLPLDWLRSLENGLPKADMVFVLDVTPQTSFKRKTEKRDVHEDDHEYLKKVRNAYLWLAKKYGWKVIDGENYPEIVHSEMCTLVTRSIRLK